MDVAQIGNLLEAALWFTVGSVVAVKAWRAGSQWRLLGFVLAAAFVVFGVTDLIESETGPWWRPLWLLLLKVACVACFLIVLARYYLVSRRRPPSAAVSSDAE